MVVSVNQFSLVWTTLYTKNLFKFLYWLILFTVKLLLCVVCYHVSHKPISIIYSTAFQIVILLFTDRSIFWVCYNPKQLTNAAYWHWDRHWNILTGTLTSTSQLVCSKSVHTLFHRKWKTLHQLWENETLSWIGLNLCWVVYAVTSYLNKQPNSQCQSTLVSTEVTPLERQTQGYRA